MTTTNIAEVQLENYLTLVDERYVALLLNAESQPVANLPTGPERISGDHPNVESLLATLTTGRSLRLVQRVPNRNGFEAWRDGGRERAENRGSEIRDAASCATAGNE